jgi:hypothetical protein
MNFKNGWLSHKTGELEFSYVELKKAAWSFD